jgi:hypothetical protein
MPAADEYLPLADTLPRSRIRLSLGANRRHFAFQGRPCSSWAAKRNHVASSSEPVKSGESRIGSAEYVRIDNVLPDRFAVERA